MATKMADTALGARIRAMRGKAGLTQAQVARALSVTKNAVTNWETGVSRPDLSLVVPLSRILNTSADALLGGALPADTLTRAEREHLSRYRRLTTNDRRSVDALLSSITEGYDESWLSENRDRFLLLPELPLSFAAGSGHPLDGSETGEPRFILRTPETQRASFLVRVNGHSMEPTFPDGCRVLVEDRTRLQEGEIGLFRLEDGDGLIKEYRKDGLYSHNPAFAPRPKDELSGAICLGHVLGAVSLDLLPDARQEALLMNDRAATAF